MPADSSQTASRRKPLRKSRSPGKFRRDFSLNIHKGTDDSCQNIKGPKWLVDKPLRPPTDQGGERLKAVILRIWTLEGWLCLDSYSRDRGLVDERADETGPGAGHDGSGLGAKASGSRSRVSASLGAALFESPPYELNDLAPDKEHAETVTRLWKILHAWQLEMKDPVLESGG